jgi:predicted XRE-type DNA-binding protein
MSDNDDLELIRGTGNIFRDFNHPDPELEQLRAILAARIIKTLDARKLTVRQAHEMTGFAAADFSRVRRANLGRFTVDRLMTMLGRLGEDVEVTVKDRPRRATLSNIETPRPV